jgi:hypothetical protein
MLHAIDNGGSVSGVAPSGVAMVDSGETLFGGQYRKWTACTAAGLFQIPPVLRYGWRLERLVWTLPGVGGIKVNVVDEDSTVYELSSIASASGQYMPEENGGLLVLPGWSVKVVGTNVLTGAGRLVAFASSGWRTDAFEVKVLGESLLPPPRQP